MGNRKLTDDYLRWILDIDGKPAAKGLNDLSTKTNDLRNANKSLSAEMEKLKARGKENSAEYKKLDAQFKENNNTIKQSELKMAALRKEIGLNGLNLKELRKYINDTKKAFDLATPNTAEHKKLNAELQAANARYKELNGTMGKANGTFGAIKTSTLAVIGVITGAISAVGGLVSNIINVYGEFEKYRSVLTNTFGSQEKANEAMAMLQDTAAKLPVSLQEVTAAYIKLVNRGFVPTQNEIIKLSDLASSQGKSLDMFVEAMLDAQTGEFERLKEFGIKAKQEGDKVTFTFRGQTETVQKTDKAIKEYLLKLGQLPGIAGSSAAVMNTLQGKISNLGDSWDRMFVAMGEGGFGGAAKRVIGFLGGMIDGFTKLISTSPAEKLREEKDELNNLVNSITSVNNNQKLRNELLGELQQKYPDFLKNLNIEKVTNEELQKRLAEVNEEYLKRIRIAVIQEDLTKNEEAMTEVMKEQRKFVKQIDEDYQSLVKNKKENATIDEKLAAISQASVDVMVGQILTSQKQDLLAGSYKRKLADLTAEQNRLEREYQDLLKERGTIKTDDSTQTVETAKIQALSDAQKQRIQLYRQYIDETRALDTALTKEEEKKLSDYFKKIKKDQADYIAEVLGTKQTLLEKENYEYQERLKKAGLFNIGQLDLTKQQLDALVVLQQEHVNNVNAIVDKQSEDDRKRNEEAFNVEYQWLQESNAMEMEALENRRISEQMTEDQYNDQKNIKLLAQLQTEKELRQQFGLSTLDIDVKINNQRAKINTDLSAKNAEIRKKEYEELKKDYEEKVRLAVDFGASVGSAVGEAIVEEKNVAKAAMKSFIIGALDMLKQYSELMIVKATIGSLASPESIATFGVAGLAKAALLTGLIEAAFAVTKGIVTKSLDEDNGYFEGGYTGSGNPHDVAYYAPRHKDEYVIPSWQKNNDPFTMQTLPILEAIRVNGKGFYDGGYTTQQNTQSSTVSQQTIPTIDPQLAQTINTLNKILENGIVAVHKWRDTDTEELATAQAKLNEIQNNASR